MNHTHHALTHHYVTDQIDAGAAADVSGRSSHETANEHMNHRSFEDIVARFEDPARAVWQKPDVVAQKLEPLLGKTVVDLGAGSGYFSVRLAALGAHVIAQDIDQRFLDFIEKRVRKEKKSKLISTLLGAPDDPRIPREAADSVLIVDVYHHLEDRITYLKRVAVGLRPGGKILVVDFKMGELPEGPPDALKVPSEVVARELREAGFREIEIDTETLPFQHLVRAQTSLSSGSDCSLLHSHRPAP